jgi:hypothetical protein
MYFRYLIVIILSLCVFICCVDTKFEKVEAPKEFVTLKNNSFRLNDTTFFPLTLNYIAEFRYNNNEFWISACKDYSHKNKAIYFDKDSSVLQFQAHMELIKEMGFNSIRLVRAGAVKIDPETRNIFVKVRTKLPKDTILELTDSPTNYNIYLEAINESIKIIENVGLKVVYLTNLSPDFEELESHFIKVAKKFQNNSTIMAYDLFNEPLYFDKKERSKEDVFEYVNDWQRMVRKYAPFHMSTIGLEGIREVFEWDPNILNVDFISYHPYEHEPKQVMNEIYWYSKYTNKPWVIGETGWYTSKLNESKNSTSQKTFVYKTLSQALNCNASGYSWWQFKDVSWKDLKNHSDLMGLVSKEGITNTKKSNFPIVGNVKNAAKVFENFNPEKKKKDCICLPNYFNYSEADVFTIKGKLIDDDGLPIEGGVVLGWSKDWNSSYHTISKSDGSFELLSSFPIYHWMASASTYEMIRGDSDPSSSKLNMLGIPTINLGFLIIEPLSFIN